MAQKNLAYNNILDIKQYSTVELYIYDLTRGLANSYSELILGKKINAIWHTSVVVYDREYYFGSMGIINCKPGETILGIPGRVVNFGYTYIPQSLFFEYLESLSSTCYRGEDYDLIQRNCNNFSNELVQFLCSKSIPEQILKLPEELLNTSLGQLIRPLLNQYTEKFAKGVSTTTVIPRMSDTEKGSEKLNEYKKDSDKEPAMIFKNIDPAKEFEEVYKTIDEKLATNDAMKDLYQYAVENEGAWCVSDTTMAFIGNLLHGENYKSITRVHLLQLLAYTALKDDVILLLHLDRKDHALMNYAYNVDKLPNDEQKALSLFICNLFGQRSSSEWLLYISEWKSNSINLNNIKVTTKVAVNALLSNIPFLQEVGCAIVHNLATKEKLTLNLTLRQILPKGSLSKVFDDVATEISMAILQFLNNPPQEERLYLLLNSLLWFACIAYNEIPALILMIGPHPDSFHGISTRIDEVIDKLNTIIVKHSK